MLEDAIREELLGQPQIVGLLQHVNEHRVLNDHRWHNPSWRGDHARWYQGVCGQWSL